MRPTLAQGKILFVGMAIDDDADWFDSEGNAHQEDCESLGLLCLP